MTEQTEEPKVDPFAHMIQFYDTWSKSWAQAMSETVSSKSFAESMGKQIESSLEALSLARKQVNEIMAQYLQQMNLPTRNEVISLAERLTKIEMVLDDIDAKLDEVLDSLKTT
jgi:hypothetical protein